MNRNIDKSIQKYDKYISKHDKCDLYYSEMVSIMDKAFNSPSDTAFTSMVISYKHDFMVGYRAALRDIRKKEGRC